MTDLNLTIDGVGISYLSSDGTMRTIHSDPYAKPVVTLHAGGTKVGTLSDTAARFIARHVIDRVL